MNRLIDVDYFKQIYRKLHSVVGEIYIVQSTKHKQPFVWKLVWKMVVGSSTTNGYSVVALRQLETTALLLQASLCFRNWIFNSLIKYT